MNSKTLGIKEIVDIYKTVKENTIYMLRLRGLSFSEIARRLGGSTKPVVIKIFREMEKEGHEEIQMRT